MEPKIKRQLLGLTVSLTVGKQVTFSFILKVKKKIKNVECISPLMVNEYW